MKKGEGLEISAKSSNAGLNSFLQQKDSLSLRLVPCLFARSLEEVRLKANNRDEAPQPSPTPGPRQSRL